MPDIPLLKALLFYIPISAIGIWRWTYWIIRQIAASLYRPNKNKWPADRPRPTVSVVTPVYNEDPEIFSLAMQSWIDNGADEVIAVIDKSNTRHIVNFERFFAKNADLKTKCRMIVTPKPGKRAALCDGMLKAQGDLIVLVDSDTIWGDGVIEKALPYFLDPQIGGATITMRIYKPKETSDVLFDILLWSRYREEVPFLLGMGKVFNTLSGRTAFYRREALLNDSHDNVHSLRHEFFLGTRAISGDDKRLTHLIVQQGWHLAFVPDAKAYTPGLGGMKKFLKQRLRWTRNSWRADLRAAAKGWVWRHPALGIFMVDRFVQPFFMLIGPIAFGFAVWHQEWLFAGILLVWWALSRFIRLFGYFRAHPGRLVYLPAYILYGYVNAAIKVYAFATLIEHSWATRWHKHRMRKGMIRKFATVTGGLAAVVVFVGVLSQFILYTRAESGMNVPASTAADTTAFTDTVEIASLSPVAPLAPATAVFPTGIQRYVVRPGDTLNKLAAAFQMDVTELKKINGIPDPDRISTGQELFYYPPKP